MTFAKRIMQSHIETLESNKNRGMNVFVCTTVVWVIFLSSKNGISGIFHSSKNRISGKIHLSKNGISGNFYPLKNGISGFCFVETHSSLSEKCNF